MSDSSPPPHGAVTADLAGRVLAGRYRLTRVIASGGMAQVWRADDLVLARPVAAKLLHPHLAADQGFVDRFRHEAIAAARLSHPSIVSIYDTVSDEGFEAIVMELVRGDTLRDRLDEKGMLDLADVVSTGAQVASALEVAHRALIVHRDIKPANILLNADGRVMVADFGIAKALQAGDRTAEGTMLGTAKYLAPEQVEGGPVDARSDVYALAVVLYECLCGRPPFKAESDAATALARLHQAPIPLRQVRPAVPQPVEAVILRAMQLRPDDRFGSAAELRRALHAAAEGRAPDAVAAPRSQNTSPPPPAPVLRPAPKPVAAAQRPTAVNIPAPPPPLRAPADRTPPRQMVPAPPSAPPSSPAQAGPRRRRRWFATALIAALVFAALAVAGVLLSRSHAGPGGLTNHQAAAPTPVSAIAATPYDPEADGEENNSTASQAIDGNPATTWRTDRYNTSTFAGLKDGVGIYVTLGVNHTLKQFVVKSPDAGWSASVYVAGGRAPGKLTPLQPYWGKALDAKTVTAGGTTTFDLGDTKGSRVLLWITKLPQSGQLHIGELQVMA